MKWWSSLLLLTFCATSVQANEAGERRSLNRLERVTGGSSDHYQSSVTPGEDEVFFSRGWKLSTQIYRQSLGPVALGGGMQPWAPDDFDTKDPALSPSGKQIAYVSFRSHARFAMESYLFQLNSWARIRFRLGNWRNNFSISVNCNSFANRIHTDTR